MPKSYVLSLLFHSVIIFLFFLPVVISSRRGSKRAKQQKEELFQYMSQKRDMLLQTAFPAYRYSYKMNFLSMQKKNWTCYVFHMETETERFLFRITHTLPYGTPGRDSDVTPYKEYYNAFTINVIPLSSYALPGSFTVTKGAHSFVKFAETVGEKFASQKEIDNVRHSRTTDVIMLGTVGKINYFDIPKSDWDSFAATGVLELFERLLQIWSNIAGISFEYKAKTFVCTISDFAHSKSNYNAYDCLESDFLLENAALFHDTIHLLNAIGCFLED